MKLLILFLPLLFTALALALLFPLISPRAGNNTWYVSASNGDDAYDCATPTTPCASIQAALDKPGFVAGDTVLVTDDVYSNPDTPIIAITQDVTLSGGWDSTFITQSVLTIIQGEQAVWIYPGVKANLSYLEMVGNYSEGLHNQGTLVLDHGRASAYNGDGFINEGSATIRNSQFDWSYGTGVVNIGTMSITNVLIDRNVIGISNGGILTMSNSMVTMHTIAFVCHGISNGGQMWVINSWVYRNGETFGFGGGICNYGDMFVINSTVKRNRVYSASGGGIYNSASGNLFLYNSSVVSNTIPFEGAGGGIVGGEVVMQNSLVTGNYANIGPDCYSNVQSLGYNLVGNTSDCTYDTGPGDVLNVPSGVFPSLGKHAPLALTSPAIDAGDPTGCKDHQGNLLLTDQRGVARVGLCDIGAYEYDPNLDPFHYIWLPWVWIISQGAWK
ncbi:MAG: hypothetical protein Fur0022_16050 [Anaerolineales bacterium]